MSLIYHWKFKTLLAALYQCRLARGEREEEDLVAAGASQTKLGSLLTGHFMDRDFCLKSLLTTHCHFVIPQQLTRSGRAAVLRYSLRTCHKRAGAVISPQNHQHVSTSARQHVSTSARQHVSMLACCQHVSMSARQHASILSSAFLAEAVCCPVQ